MHHVECPDLLQFVSFSLTKIHLFVSINHMKTVKELLEKLKIFSLEMVPFIYTVIGFTV